MLTIFTTPKPFVGIFETIQINAIKSWKNLSPEIEVILLGNDLGVAEISDKYGCIHIPNVPLSDFGTPLVSGLFSEAEIVAKNDILCYVNCDIIFNNTLLESIRIVKSWKKFLLVGQRYDVDILEALNLMVSQNRVRPTEH
jgi:hypothetical protein